MPLKLNGSTITNSLDVKYKDHGVDRPIDLVQYKNSPSDTSINYRGARPFLAENVAEAYQCCLKPPNLTTGQPPTPARGILMDTRNGKNKFVGFRGLQPSTICKGEPTVPDRNNQRTGYEYDDIERLNFYFLTDYVRFTYTVMPGYAGPYQNFSTSATQPSPIIQKRLLPQDISFRADQGNSLLKEEQIGPTVDELVECSLSVETTTDLNVTNHIEAPIVTTNFTRSTYTDKNQKTGEFYWRMIHSPNSTNVKKSVINYKIYDYGTKEFTNYEVPAFSSTSTVQDIDRFYSGEDIQLTPFDSPKQYGVCSSTSIRAANTAFPQDADERIGVITNFNFATTSTFYEPRKPGLFNVALTRHLHINGDAEGNGTRVYLERGPISKELGLSVTQEPYWTPNTSRGIVGDANQDGWHIDTMYPLDKIRVFDLQVDEGGKVSQAISDGRICQEHIFDDQPIYIKPTPILYNSTISTDSHCSGTFKLISGPISQEIRIPDRSGPINKNENQKLLEGRLNDTLFFEMIPDEGYDFTATSFDFTKPIICNNDIPSSIVFSTTLIIPNVVEVSAGQYHGQYKDVYISSITEGTPRLTTIRYRDSVGQGIDIAGPAQSAYLQVEGGVSSLNLTLTFDNHREVTLPISLPSTGVQKYNITPKAITPVVNILPPIVTVQLYEESATGDPDFITLNGTLTINNPNNYTMKIQAINIEVTSGGNNSDYGDGDDSELPSTIIAPMATNTGFFYTDINESRSNTSVGTAVVVVRGECNGQTGAVNASYKGA